MACIRAQVHGLHLVSFVTPVWVLFWNLTNYNDIHPWFGATVRRVANRIAKGKFTLDGKEYSLEINNPSNSLHSGSKGLSRTLWKAEPLHEAHAAAGRFTGISPDGEPGLLGSDQY
jgi:aldose 1-epimerase